MTDFGFSRQRYDSYINLVELGARWYDPDLGRFTQPDTIIPQPGNPQSFNRYSYVNNRPMNLVDPTGHEGECQSWDTTCWEDRYFNALGLYRNSKGEYKRQGAMAYKDKDILSQLTGVTDPAMLNALWLLTQSPTGKKEVDFAVIHHVGFAYNTFGGAAFYSGATNTVYIGGYFVEYKCGSPGQGEGTYCPAEPVWVDPLGLAHELVHAIQSSAGRVPEGAWGSIENELEANRVTVRVGMELAAAGITDTGGGNHPLPNTGYWRTRYTDLLSMSISKYSTNVDMRDWFYHSPFYTMYNNGMGPGPLCLGPLGCGSAVRPFLP